MPTKKIATSTLWQLLSQVTMAALSILTVKFVAIGLTKELAGVYNSAYGFLQVFGILADFGLYAVAVREVSSSPLPPAPSPEERGRLASKASAANILQERKRSEVLSALIILRTIILCLSLGSAILLVWLVPHWQGTPLPLSVTLAAFVPFFTLLAGILRTIFQVHYKMHYVFIAEVAQRIVSTGSIVALVLWFGLQQSANEAYVYIFILCGAVGSSLLFLLSFVIGRQLMPFSFTVHRETIVLLIKRAAPYGIAFLCVALYRQFDLTIIALLRSDFELQNAYYGFVVRMADMGFLIPTFLLNSTLPMLSESDARGEDTRQLLGKTMLILLILGSIAALFSFFWARPLIALLTTEQYLSTSLQPGSDTALRWMSIPLFLNGLILYGFYVLLNKHVWQRLVVCLLFAAGLALGLNMFLVPAYGFMGAVWTSIVVHALLTVVLVPQGLRVMQFSLSVHAVLRWLLFSVLLGLGLWFSQPYLVHEFTTVMGLGLATVGMGALLWGTGLLKVLGIRY